MSLASLLYLIFFLSGASALVFESLWFFQAGLALGNSIWASSLVLASFMAGLAAGNAWVSLRGDPLVAVQGVILFILSVFIIKNLVDFFRSYLVARVEQGVTRDLRREAYDHLLELDLGFFGRTAWGRSYLALSTTSSRSVRS